jgi:ATP-dependent 26S proteasome regulatory subunit
MIFKSNNSTLSEPSQPNSRWLDDAMADWASSASTVLTIETADPRREGQLIDHIILHFEHVYRYHPWTGLEHADRNTGRFATVTVSAGSDYEPGLQNECRDLGGALRHMDRLLCQQQAALVLRGLDRPDGRLDLNADLINALRAWTVSGDILARKSVVCLISPNPLSAVDQATLDQTSLVRPELASYEERLALVRDMVRRAQARLDEDRQRAIALATAGLNLHQTRRVLLKTYHTEGGFPAEKIKRLKSEHVRRSEVLEVEDPKVTFHDIGGYEAAKRLVAHELIWPLENPQRAKQSALPLPRGILLFGPPGTGKTLFAKALAGQVNLPFVHLKPENIFHSYLGVSGQNLAKAIRLIEDISPALVFVDEIDRFGRRTASPGDGASQERNDVFGQMLTWLGDEGRQSIIVGTTNVPDNLDEAFLRPGRFSIFLPFLYPDEDARRQILLAHLGLIGGRPRPLMDEASIRKAVDQIAAQTGLYAGADLELLVTRAKQRFCRSDSKVMSDVHLLEAHRDYRVETETRKSLEEQYRAMGPIFANSLELLARTE